MIYETQGNLALKPASRRRHLSVVDSGGESDAKTLSESVLGFLFDPAQSSSVTSVLAGRVKPKLLERDDLAFARVACAVAVIALFAFSFAAF